MLLSKLVGERTRENPTDVQIRSHILLLRAGYIKPVGNGIFTLGTAAKKMALKIENIIREEMDALDGQEVLFPVVMPKELLEESGRYTSIGSELVRFADRGERGLVLGMTHEEAAVHFARNNVTSHNQLPFMIYQIQTKFRDEPRCRGGLIRVREFTMKDAYSFHLSQEDLDQYYEKCHQAYMRIFERIGLVNFISVKSDTGMMGGSMAHEYMLLNANGEDSLIICPKCDYRANMEIAENTVKAADTSQTPAPLAKVDTGKAKTIEDLVKLLNVSADKTIKAVVYAVKGGDKTVVAFTRGDYEINEAKLKRVTKMNVAPCASLAGTGLIEGNIGPLGLDKSKTVAVFDISLRDAVNMVAGANIKDMHYTGFCMNREMSNVEFFDISKVREDGVCPQCGANITIQNGIEIGNIFQLGTKYTKSMNMTVLNKEGAAVNPIMGCYGIGVGRAIASIIEENNDDKGMILPPAVAPWLIHLCAIKCDDPSVMKYAQSLYEQLTANGIEVLFDERCNVSAGVKLTDADLMGMPYRVIVSPKTMADDCVEVTDRKTKTTAFVKRAEIIKHFK